MTVPGKSKKWEHGELLDKHDDVKDKHDDVKDKHDDADDKHDDVEGQEHVLVQESYLGWSGHPA